MINWREFVVKIDDVIEKILTNLLLLFLNAVTCPAQLLTKMRSTGFLQAAIGVASLLLWGTTIAIFINYYWNPTAQNTPTEAPQTVQAALIVHTYPNGSVLLRFTNPRVDIINEAMESGSSIKKEKTGEKPGPRSNDLETTFAQRNFENTKDHFENVNDRRHKRVIRNARPPTDQQSNAFAKWTSRSQRWIKKKKQTEVKEPSQTIQGNTPTSVLTITTKLELETPMANSSSPSSATPAPASTSPPSLTSENIESPATLTPHLDNTTSVLIVAEIHTISPTDDGVNTTLAEMEDAAVTTEALVGPADPTPTPEQRITLLAEGKEADPEFPTGPLRTSAIAVEAGDSGAPLEVSLEEMNAWNEIANATFRYDETTEIYGPDTQQTEEEPLVVVEIEQNNQTWKFAQAFRRACRAFTGIALPRTEEVLAADDDQDQGNKTKLINHPNDAGFPFHLSVKTQMIHIYGVTTAAVFIFGISFAIGCMAARCMHARRDRRDFPDGTKETIKLDALSSADLEDENTRPAAAVSQLNEKQTELDSNESYESAPTEPTRQTPEGEEDADAITIAYEISGQPVTRTRSAVCNLM